MNMVTRQLNSFIYVCYGTCVLFPFFVINYILNGQRLGQPRYFHTLPVDVLCMTLHRMVKLEIWRVVSFHCSPSHSHSDRVVVAVRLNRSVWKLFVLDRNTWHHITMCKLFVSRRVTWSYSCLFGIIISYLKPYICMQRNGYFEIERITWKHVIV